jgi:hypothetical protein
METFEQMMKDSDMIFKQITSGDFNNIDQIKHLIATLYIPDMGISRSGISHALKRLEEHCEKESEDAS